MATGRLALPPRSSFVGIGCPPGSADAAPHSIVYSSVSALWQGQLASIRARTRCRRGRCRRNARAFPRGAFTLLEVLLSLAIIALVATVLIGGSARLLSDQPVSTYDVFWKAVRQARKTALLAEHDIRLKFDARNKQFVIIDGLAPSRLAADGFTREEVPLETFPVHPSVAADLTVEFLSANKGGNMILIGGVVVESQTLPYVTFYSDGTCTPFRLQLMREGGASTLAVDPWTCAPILRAGDPNTSPTS